MRIFIFAIILLGITTVSYFQYVAGINLFDLVYIAYSAQLALFAVVVIVLYYYYSGIKVLDPAGIISISAGLLGGAGSVIYAILSAPPDQLPAVYWGPIIAPAAAIIGLVLGLALFRSRTSSIQQLGKQK